MRPPDEVKREFVRQWLAKAEEDFGVAGGVREAIQKTVKGQT